MIYSVHQPQYLPWIGFFDKIRKSDCFVFLDNVDYKHREYQNRNRILTKSGPIWLTVPVHSHQGVKVRDVEIDNSRDWRQAHRRSMESCYARASFFKRYFPALEELYSRDWERLMDLNVAIIEFLMKQFDITTKILYESQLAVQGEKTERILNIGKALGADEYLSGQGGRDYLDAGSFERDRICLTYQEFSHPVYKQVFAEQCDNFIPFMSAVDLLFNEGPVSGDILKRC